MLEIRKYRYGNKLVSLPANIMKESKDQLDQCLLYARAYNQREKLEGSFVLNLAKRLPFEAKQKYLDFLFDGYGSTNEPTYQRVRQTTAKSNESHPLAKSSDSAAVYRGGDNQSPRGGGARNAPLCIYCSLRGKDVYHCEVR